MADAVIADKKPAVIQLEPGKSYWWCACGKSKDQPWCDGSHKGSEFAPLEVQVDRPKNYALCQCKRSGDQPWCDGAHSKL